MSKNLNTPSNPHCKTVDTEETVLYGIVALAASAMGDALGLRMTDPKQVATLSPEMRRPMYITASNRRTETTTYGTFLSKETTTYGTFVLAEQNTP